MKTYSVKKGRHFSFPRRIRFTKCPSKITWKVIFDSNCNYILKNADGSVSKDQKDWNKLCGIFYSLVNTRKNSVMMGWKYNVDEDLIDLAPYYHIDSGRDLFPPMLQVLRGEEVELTLDIDYTSKTYHWTMKKDGFTNTHSMQFTHSKKWCSYINFYFGGNQRSPQRVSAKIGLSVTKV